MFLMTFRERIGRCECELGDGPVKIGFAMSVMLMTIQRLTEMFAHAKP